MSDVFQPTPSQEVAITVSNTFLNDPDPDNNEMLLSGYAGTGKTTVLKYILQGHLNKKIVACTISHAAKGVLKDNMPEDVTCVTLAKGLNLKQEFVHGVEKFVKDTYSTKPPIVYDCDILIVDESSMLDSPILRHIRGSVNNTCKIIFSGDKAQLPPVVTNRFKKQSISPVFSLPLQVTLTEVVRYGALVGALGQYYRDMIEFVEKGGDENAAIQSVLSFMPNWNDGNEMVFFTRDVQWFLQSAITDFSADMLNTRIIAYRNETIDSNNDVIRPYFYDPYEKYAVGEYLILNRPYGDGKSILHNGTVIKVVKTSVKDHTFSVKHPTEKNRVNEYKHINLKVWILTVKIVDIHTREEEDQEYVVKAIHQDSEEDYEDIQQAFVKKAQDTNTSYIWRDLSQLRSENIFAGRYYCMSAYKSQGQSISNVYYMLSDTMDVDAIDTLTKLRTTYVACTRSKKKLIVLLS